MEPEAADCFYDAIRRCRALEGRHLFEWECVDRFVEAYFAACDHEDPLRSAVNHKAFVRDRGRCLAPGCSARDEIEGHHVKWRSRLGSDSLENIASLCHPHHGRGIHEGLIEVEGEAPNGLTWKLGVGPNGEPLKVVGPGEKILGPRRAARKSKLLDVWKYCRE